jgi:hypothetical protein
MKVCRLEPRSRAQRLREPVKVAKALVRRLQWQHRPPWPDFREPFNGQEVRRTVFEHLVAQFAPTAFIETGTFIGSTTRYLATFGLDTYTVEVHPGYQALARLALRSTDGVTLLCGDSAAGIRHLAEEGTVRRPLAYLDAHWGPRVPLAEELDCLFGIWDEVLVVIDDFQVPADPGYGYDIYAGVPLAAASIRLPGDARLAYPSAPALSETGARRGTAFVARGAAARDALESAEREGMVCIAGR